MGWGEANHKANLVCQCTYVISMCVCECVCECVCMQAVDQNQSGPGLLLWPFIHSFIHPFVR